MKLVLASSSPRRRQLLSEAGLRFSVFKPDVDETPLRGESPLKLVKRLSFLKAQAYSKKRSVILAADTIVISPNGKSVLGKPESTEDARRMLRMLQGKVHTVITGYCLKSNEQQISRAVRSRVKMRSLNKTQINNYLKTKESFDKAGSYAIQGYGMALVERVTGSYTNVVGLPVCEVLRDLEESFSIQLFKLN